MDIDNPEPALPKAPFIGPPQRWTLKTSIKRENKRLLRLLTRADRKQLKLSTHSSQVPETAFETNQKIKALLGDKRPQRRTKQNEIAVDSPEECLVPDSQLQISLSNMSVQDAAETRYSDQTEKIERTSPLKLAGKEPKTKKIKKSESQKSWEDQITQHGRWTTPNRALLFWAAVQLQFFHDHFEFGVEQSTHHIAQRVSHLLQGETASWDLSRRKRSVTIFVKVGKVFASRVQLAHGKALNDPEAPPGNPQYARQQSEIAYVLIKGYANELPPDSAAAVLNWTHVKLKHIAYRFGGLQYFELAIANGFLEDDQRVNMGYSQQLALEYPQSTKNQASSSSQHNNTDNYISTEPRSENINPHHQALTSSQAISNQTMFPNNDNSGPNSDIGSEADFNADDDSDDGGVALMGAYDAATLDLQRHMAMMSVRDRDQELRHLEQQQHQEQEGTQRYLASGGVL